MSTDLSSTKFFTDMISGYRNKNTKTITSMLKLLFENGNQCSSQQWNQSFNFKSFASIDNMAGTFFNILQALQQWQIQRLSKQYEESFFDSYLVALELCLMYLNGMDKTNQWISPCIKYLVMKSKYVFNECKNREYNQITINKSLERLIQQLRDFKASSGIDQQIEKSFKLMINNLLVSCYLSIRDYTKSRNIIEDKNVKRDLSSFSQQQINNHYFQTARIDIAYKRPIKAIKSLMAIKFTTNKQRNMILRYLIPCNLYAWKIPTFKLYPEYNQLAEAIIEGNFSQYSNVVSKNKMLWIKRGMFELITGLEVLVWRNFIKNIQKSLQCENISIKSIAQATKLMGTEISHQQCLFHVTNLIKLNYLKGYIYVTGDNQKTLVFKTKKGDVFPKITTD